MNASTTHPDGRPKPQGRASAQSVGAGLRGNLRNTFMTNEQSAYPLSWPLGWPRTKTPQRSRFGTYYKKPSVAAARDLLLLEVQRLSGTKVVLSTNVSLRRDGLPYSNQGEPKDTGAAIYFELKGKPRVLACDRWSTLGDNIWAIAKHVEALRGQDRWGVGSVEQAFAGYAALPPPSSDANNCWSVLCIPFGASVEHINAAYRELSQVRHPDRGGSHDAMAALNKAREEALAVAKGKP